MTAYPVVRAWTADGATWNSATTTDNWETPGAQGSTDIGSSIGQFQYNGGNPETGTLDITLTARQWQAGTADNNGILIEAPNESFDFASVEFSTTGYRPRLELELTEPE